VTSPLVERSALGDVFDCAIPIFIHIGKPSADIEIARIAGPPEECHGPHFISAHPVTIPVSLAELAASLDLATIARFSI
jgi:hypothetical protein